MSQSENCENSLPGDQDSDNEERLQLASDVARIKSDIRRYKKDIRRFQSANSGLRHWHSNMDDILANFTEDTSEEEDAADVEDQIKNLTGLLICCYEQHLCLPAPSELLGPANPEDWTGNVSEMLFSGSVEQSRHPYLQEWLSFAVRHQVFTTFFEKLVNKLAKVNVGADICKWIAAAQTLSFLQVHPDGVDTCLTESLWSGLLHPSYSIDS